MAQSRNARYQAEWRQRREEEMQALRRDVQRLDKKTAAPSDKLGPAAFKAAVERRVEDVLRKKVDAEFARLQAQFNEAVEARVAVRLAAREAWFDEQEELVKEKEAQLDAARAHITQYMTQLEYKLVLGCLHPDRANADAEEQAKYNKAFTIFKRLEPYGNLHIPLKVLRARGWAK